MIKRLGIGSGLAAVLICIISGVSVYAAPLLLTQETFAGTQTPANAWTYGGRSCLSAATDPAPATSIPACPGGPYSSSGDGFLVLSSGGGDSGFVVYNTPLSSNAGLHASFDMSMFDGTNGGGDGLSFFLLNGTASPTQPGGSGGGLGYSRIMMPAPGIDGGYVGVLFDKFGNASVDGNGTGGPGISPDSIVIRGSQASDYKYIIGVPALQSLDGVTKDAAKIHVDVIISTTNYMRVQLTYQDGTVQTLPDINLNTINGAGSLPPTIKFGFGASTGWATDTQTINNLVATLAAPDVAATQVTLPAAIHRGGVFTATLQGENVQIAGPTTGTITMTSVLPTGISLRSASGSGWTCGSSGQTVTCTRPGSGANSVAAGTNLPPLQLKLAASSVAAETGTIQATFSTVDDDSSANSTASATYTLLAADPSASTTDNEQLANTGNDQFVVMSIAAVLIGLAIGLRRIKAMLV